MSEDSIFERTADAIGNGLNGLGRMESRILDEIGFSSPTAKTIAKAGEAVLGGGMMMAGIATSEIGVGLPLLAAGSALVLDASYGLAGMDDKGSLYITPVPYKS